jgi:hypothetical protein
MHDGVISGLYFIGAGHGIRCWPNTRRYCYSRKLRQNWASGKSKLMQAAA